MPAFSRLLRGGQLCSGHSSAFLFAIALSWAASKPAVAAWSTDPKVNNAVTTATGHQKEFRLVGDGSGGSIVVWQDIRGSDYDIYAQRLDSNGVAQWAANGVPLCTVDRDQQFPQLASDGAGGAIVVWNDARNSPRIYAQRVDGSGTVKWTPDGVVLCAATGEQNFPQIVSDGAGGAIVVWEDLRSASGDIYVRRINSSGTPQWNASGVVVSTAAGDQFLPEITSDGSGGAIIAWTDRRNGTSNNDVYAQRINSSGVAQWTANGVAITTATSNQDDPQLIGDGAGGAVVVWEDTRSGIPTDIYAQRIDSTGVAQWTANGVALCTATGAQTFPELVSDGAGGAIVAWMDKRSGTRNDIYARRIDSAGTPQWTSNGVPISTVAGNKEAPQLLSHGAGGAIITWHDYRSGTTFDIYAQRVNDSGTAQWLTNGVVVSSASDSVLPQIVSDGSGGAIISWMDLRNGRDYDIYASHISSGGILPVSLSGFTLD